MTFNANLNNLLIRKQELTMSSLEIAELTSKLHKNVLADCRKIVSEYEKLYTNQPAMISALVKSTTYKDKNNEDRPAFDLSFDAVLDLMTGYSFPMRHAVNQRWKELELEYSKSTESRLSSKTGFAPMTAAIQEDHDDPKFFHYTNEIDMLNRIVTGLSSKKLIEERSGDSKVSSARDLMTSDELYRLSMLQQMNTMLIMLGKSFKERKQELIDYHNNKLIAKLLKAA